MLIRCYVQILTLQKPHIPASFNMYLVISNCVTAVILSNFSHHYLCNRSTLDTGFLVKSVYFNLRNILPKSGTFPPGHPVYESESFVRSCQVQMISPHPKLCEMFCNTVQCLWWEVVSISPNTQAGGPPLLGCAQLLIQYICSYPPKSGGCSYIYNLRTCHAAVTRTAYHGDWVPQFGKF